MQSIVDSFGPTAATLGGGFFVGVLIGYALKKVIKLVAIIFGLFLAGLAYLQTQQITNINWNKLQTVSERYYYNNFKRNNKLKTENILYSISEIRYMLAK